MIENNEKKVERLPIFVYGTLLTGHPNYKRFGLNRPGVVTRCVAAELKRHTLYARPGDWFPYLIPTPAVPLTVRPQIRRHTVIGELLTISEEHFDRIIRDLDHLEGVPQHYTRDKMRIAGQSAWVYRPSWRTMQELFAPIFSDFRSWNDHVQAHNTYPLGEGT